MAKVDAANDSKKVVKQSNDKKKRDKPGIFSRIARYFKDLRSEAKKIVWPTRSQAINNTLVVIAMLLIVGLFICGIDALFGFIIRTLLGNG